MNKFITILYTFHCMDNNNNNINNNKLRRQYDGTTLVFNIPFLRSATA